MPPSPSRSIVVPLLGLAAVLFAGVAASSAEETLFLRQPSLSAEHVAFVHGADLWIADRTGGLARRLTSTPAVEADPHLSPDGREIAFTSNRSGVDAVYVVPIEGGEARRLSWYPASSEARGWSPDGTRVLYASTRESAPVGYRRLWTVARDGGSSERLPAPWGFDGSFSPDGSRIVVDRVSRWDSGWRHYRGGHNTPLVILDLEDLGEVHLPNERTTDVEPVWMGETVYFLSDRDWSTNVFAYRPATGTVEQLTDFPDGDVHSLDGHDGSLVFERAGRLHTLEVESGEVVPLAIEVRGDFPWAAPHWEDVADEIRSAALSATGKRALFEARGEIFTVPAEEGDVRNLTRSPGVADRAPVWSPEGRRVAWFSHDGDGIELRIGDQDGLSEPRRLGIGESKMAWSPAWSPDGKHLAFVDDDVRIRVVDVGTGEIRTADVGGTNMDRERTGLAWSPDSRWLAYAKTAPNDFRRIVVWSLETGETTALTNPLADAMAPSWDRDGRHLWFLASTDVALASGLANTSSIKAEPTYAAYVVVLDEETPSPFAPESDEEPVDGEGDGSDAAEGENGEAEDGEEAEADEASVEVRIDVDGIARRTLALPLEPSTFFWTLPGPAGSVILVERTEGQRGFTLHLFRLEEAEAEELVDGVASPAVSSDGRRLLVRVGETWKIVEIPAASGRSAGAGFSPGGSPRGPSGGADGENGALAVALEMRLDPRAEWRQIFEEAWRYERDLFYDPGTHGRDWDDVRERLEPLVEHVRHRAELNVLLDRLGAELSVGHSFVGGGDLPEVPESRVGLLGVDLVADSGRWRIGRIYTFESWNPGLVAPLDRPGLDVSEGDFLLAVDGEGLRAGDDPFRLFDGTAGRQTVLTVNDRPSLEGARRVTVEPVESESSLRQLAWVEDNRRRVDELSDGRLGYVWVPNTSTPGIVSFDRYFFAQQDRPGAVIDERFNGGGSLDDYMVDLMSRSLRAAITNEVPDGRPFRLPAGILGPKVLLINELAGSGGDYFPWVFRRLGIGPLIGTRTWGGLVKSSVHYRFVDGGWMTAPDNAVFDPLEGEWIAENEGVPPDIEVAMDARSVAEGRDPQLERGVEEALRLLEEEGVPEVVPPPFPRPAAPPERGEP